MDNSRRLWVYEFKWMWSWEKAWRLKHKATIFALLLKGRMSRICQLRFVNTTFKVGPSSPAPASSWMRAYDLAPGRNIFIVVPPSHPARCYWLGTTQPLPKSWRPETSQTQHNKKIRAEGRFSADTPRTYKSMCESKCTFIWLVFVWRVRVG